MKKILTMAALAAGLLGGVPAQAQTWRGASNLLAFTLPTLAGAYALDRHDLEGLSQLAWGLGSTVGATLVLKSQIDEVRPDGSGHDSFPSGHTAVAFSAARFIQKRYGEQVSPVALYGAASLTALARVRARQHYWKDTVAGAALGYAMADWFTQSPSGDQLALWPTPGGMAMLWHHPL